MYNIYGIEATPYSVNGKRQAAVYDVYGNGTYGNLILDENFDSIDENLWRFKSGAYRDWQYLPENHANNAFVDSGKLVIQNLKDNPTPQFAWSGAYMDTKGKFSFQTGSVQVRMKFSSADYYHCTFWLLGENFNGEIDLAECDSGEVFAYVHYFDSDGNLHSKHIGMYDVDATQFNVYQLDWSEDKLRFICNGKLLGTFNISDATIDGHNSFNQPYYLIINTNPYSTSSNEYCSGESVVNEVDYVRVYGLMQ